MSNLPAQTTPVYCTDEDIAVRAGLDFANLCPLYQKMAQGVDGAFASGLPWKLSSASVNFGANNVGPNQVVQLTGPKSQYPGGGDLLAIDSVSTDGTTLTLRRLHQDLNVGQPPAPAAGLSGVSYLICTLNPQIEEVSFDLKRRFGIDETVVYRQSNWIFDLRDLRMATILTVLLQRYTAESRSDRGDYSRKIGLIKNEMSVVLDRVQVRWGPFGNSAEPSTLFNCKLSR